MRKTICFLLAFLMLFFTVACSSNNELPNEVQKAENIVINYANAVINAWECGLNNDCIFEDEDVKDFESPENFDLEQLVSITGFDKSMIEDVLFDNETLLSQRTVNIYKNKFYNNEGVRNLEYYNTLLHFNGITSPLESDEYVSVLCNVEMVQYLFEEIYEEKFTEIMSNISSSNDNYAKLNELKKYTDTVVATCLDAEEFEYTFPSNFTKISLNIQQRCRELLDISN